MRLLLPWLCVLAVARVHGIFEGTCVRKDPPPGVLVLSPGSKLVLTCRGQVMVNGLTVNVASSSSVSVGNTANQPQSNSGRTAATGESRQPRHAGTTASPTTQGVRHLSTESAWAHEEKSSDGDYDEEEDEEEEGNRVTRGINHWKWDGRMIWTAKTERGGIRFERRGAVLSLPLVGPRDSGSYACHHSGRERFSLKVIVADPPKSPSLSCYKKSPSSKLRCESDLLKPPAKHYSCYLLLSKRPSATFHPFQCTYSSRLSRYWCALEPNEDELRTVHKAYLCVTSITGNVTSDLLSFTPLQILKPDPPSHVKVHQVEGQQTHLRVTWGYPASWKSNDNYYWLIYEVKYKPKQSSFHYEQIMSSGTMKLEIIDVMPGVEYQVQVRTKDEYDGQWSDWGEPVSGWSWTEPRASTTPESAPSEGSTSTTDEPRASTTPQSTPSEGSTSTTDEPVPTEPAVDPVSYHALWICGFFLVLSGILAVYIFRHKDRFMPKLHHLSLMNQHDDSYQPPSPGSAAHEVQGLVTFAPRCYQEHQQSNTEEEDEEEQPVEDRMEAVHFDNMSYFQLHEEYGCVLDQVL